MVISLFFYLYILMFLSSRIIYVIYFSYNHTIYCFFFINIHYFLQTITHPLSVLLSFFFLFHYFFLVSVFDHFFPMLQFHCFCFVSILNVLLFCFYFFFSLCILVGHLIFASYSFNLFSVSAKS